MQRQLKIDNFILHLISIITLGRHIIIHISCITMYVLIILPLYLDSLKALSLKL